MPPKAGSSKRAIAIKISGFRTPPSALPIAQVAAKAQTVRPLKLGSEKTTEDYSGSGPILPA